MTIDWIKFLDAIERAKDDLNCHDFGAWYRGLSCSKYRLYPSLLRPRSRITPKNERAIFEDFADFDNEADRGTTSWDRLVKLQHHGTPTRLLDWTEVFGVALFFAMGGGQKKEPKSPAIWIINPFKISQVGRGSDDKRLACFHLETDRDYFAKFLAGQQCTWPFIWPMPYRPPKLTPRIRAQRGFFTVHGTDRRPLDAIYHRYVRQVRLPPAAHPDARRFLAMAGLDSLTLFPDLEGFVRRIRDRYE